jgi:hypothetical protein
MVAQNNDRKFVVRVVSQPKRSRTIELPPPCAKRWPLPRQYLAEPKGRRTWDVERAWIEGYRSSAIFEQARLFPGLRMRIMGLQKFPNLQNEESYG